MCWPARWPSQPGTSRVSVAARGVSGAIAATVATRQSVALITLFKPGVSAIVVAERLPEARLVLVHEMQPAHPLRALPEVQVRDEQTGRAAVLGLEVAAVVAVHDPCTSARQVLERKVGGVAAVRERRDIAAERLDPLEQRVDGYALPARVELRPGGDAMDVDGRRLGLERMELVPGPLALGVDRACDPERPLVRGRLGRGAGAEPREAALEVLAGREPVAGLRVPPLVEAARDHAGVWQTASALLPSGSRMNAP